MERVNEPLQKAFSSRHGSIPMFLRDVFTFLATKTDFYHINQGPEDPRGLLPMVAEKMTMTTFQECDPYKSDIPRNCNVWYNNVFLPAAIAHEVEVSTTQDVESFSVDYGSEIIEDCIVSEEVEEETHTTLMDLNSANMESLNLNVDNEDIKKNISIFANKSCNESIKPLTSTSSINTDSFNGAAMENYSWSQNIKEIDITIKLPESITSSKNLKINTTSENISVEYLSIDSKWTTIVKDKFSYKIKAGESVWTLSEGNLRIHLEKHMEKWWNSLLESEPKLDTSKLECSRPLHEFSEDHLAKINELQYNHLQKLAGKPTIDMIQNEEILKRAWNAPGSPFMNQPFDANIL